jgi:hypothetical protein
MSLWGVPARPSFQERNFGAGLEPTSEADRGPALGFARVEAHVGGLVHEPGSLRPAAALPSSTRSNGVSMQILAMGLLSIFLWEPVSFASRLTSPKQ